MLDFDANGIYQNAYGEKTFKRIASFYWNGEVARGGVYTGQSTDQEFLIELYQLKSSGEIEDGIEEHWVPTGELIHVPMSQIIRIDDPFS